MKSNLFVSVVLVQDKPLKTLESDLCQIQNELDSHYSDYEIVIISQGTDKVYTYQDEAVLCSIPSLRYIQLASVVPFDVACAAALENAIGDFIVMFNPAFDPPITISETVDICKSGFDVVVGVASQSRTLAYKIFRSMAKSILTLVDYSLPRDATSLRCLSRRAVNSVTSTGRFHHQLSMRIQKTGYPQKSYFYKLVSSELSKFPRSLFSGFRDLLRLLIFNSSRPLRWMTGVGLFGSLSAFLFAVYSLFVHLINGHVVEGWTTTILFMSILFMMQFIMMAFFGEYLGRLLDDRSEQSSYSVVFEKNSIVMVNQNRVNVLSDSVNKEVNFVQTGRNG
ncbi:MAG: glycosyl transferase family 2 [Bacteroidota bacterium]